MPRKTEEKAFYSVTEAADLLGCDPSTLRKRIAAGTLEAQLVGRQYIISAEAVANYKHAKPGPKLGSKNKKKSRRK